MNTEFHTHFEWFMQMYIYKTWMEGTYDIPNKNKNFFVTTEPRGANPKRIVGGQTHFSRPPPAPKVAQFPS